MSMPYHECEISIIIVTYNSYHNIKYCLNSLFKSKLFLTFEAIIVDNNSTDRTVEQIKKLPFDLKLIENNSNLGFARACNEGIKSAKGKYIFLLNPDTELLNTSLDIFFDFMEKKENELVWCVGAQLYNEFNNPAKSNGHFPTLLDVIYEQSGIKGLLLKIPQLKDSIKHKIIIQNREVPFVMGCDMFIRKSVLNEVGLFNERFFLNYEETELSWRANKAGFKSVILPEAKILHYSGRSFTDLKSYLSYLWYGQLLFFKLTQRHSIFIFAKSIHLLGTVLRLIFKFDKFYWNHFKNILSI